MISGLTNKNKIYRKKKFKLLYIYTSKIIYLTSSATFILVKKLVEGTEWQQHTTIDIT